MDTKKLLLQGILAGINTAAKVSLVPRIINGVRRQTLHIISEEEIKLLLYKLEYFTSHSALIRKILSIFEILVYHLYPILEELLLKH